MDQMAVWEREVETEEKGVVEGKKKSLGEEEEGSAFQYIVSSKDEKCCR